MKDTRDGLQTIRFTEPAYHHRLYLCFLNHLLVMKGKLRSVELNELLGRP
jgi:hypothetical protein